MATDTTPDPGDGGGVIGGGGSTPTPAPTPTPPPAPSVPPPPVIPPPPPSPQIVGSTVSNNSRVGVIDIPLAAIPAQRIAIQLGDQPCTIDVFQKLTGLYLNLYIADVPIILGALCLNANYLVRDAYLGFTGELFFIDTEGETDPDYTGLGGRYSLMWIYPL